MQLTDRNKTIDFQNVEALSRKLRGEKFIPTPFRLQLPVADVCNALYAAMIAETAVRSRSLILDEDTKEHIRQAAQWLTTPGGKPGLLLFGNVGNGKTTLAKAIASMISYITERELGYDKRKTVRLYKAKSVIELRAKSDRFKDSHTDYERLFKTEMLIIDDLGEEPKELIVYGQPETPVIDLLSERYDRQLFTIVTTNLGKESLSEKYGTRIYDRFREWLHPIPFTNASYRGGR